MFNTGDLIVQRHQTGAQPCLVLGVPDPDAGVVVVWSPGEQRYKRVFAAAYDLVSAATVASLESAVDHTLSEAYERTTSSAQW